MLHAVMAISAWLFSLYYIVLFFDFSFYNRCILCILSILTMYLCIYLHLIWFGLLPAAWIILGALHHIYMTAQMKWKLQNYSPSFFYPSRFIHNNCVTSAPRRAPIRILHRAEARPPATRVKSDRVRAMKSKVRVTLWLVTKLQETTSNTLC